ncbi:xyloglucan:xyloglucosyl transferase [Trifolium repens]|nr:xyloglucan:xyloglucosyl transferase [Trifolium repens]
MASSYANNSIFLLLCLCLSFSTIAYGGNFNTDFNILFGDKRAIIQDGGNSMTLTMDKYSGSGIGTKNEYLFGRFDMQIKLVPGNSAGTVTTIYDFHTYSIDWNAQRIIILVDNIPIRVIHNRQNIGVAFPTRQPMKLYTTLWNGDTWATRGGIVKIYWSKAPFTAGLRNFNANACIPSPSNNCLNFNGGKNKGLSSKTRKQLKVIHSKWVVYDYCRDFRRYARGLPYECRKTNNRLADL